MNNKASLLATIFMLTAVYACNNVEFGQGKRLYERFCADCHMVDATGVADLYPTLLGRNTLENFKDIPCIIRSGIDDTTTAVKMLGFPQLTDVQINNIVNYMVRDLLSSDKQLHLPETKELLLECPVKKTYDFN